MRSIAKPKVLLQASFADDYRLSRGATRPVHSKIAAPGPNHERAFLMGSAAQEPTSKAALHAAAIRIAP